MTTISNGESGLSVRNKLNDALSKIEGTTPLTSVDINSGAIDGTTIGATTPSTGAFTDAESANFDLTAIAETKAITAVDVFVYDTSKDSDGGAWRKRTQHTSWYNETLNTATRGSRREFPAVAVIVAESNKVTIYDGDDPALPMWMVFLNTSWANGIPASLTGANVTSIAGLNGKLVFSSSNPGGVDGGVVIVSFVSDDATIETGVGWSFTISVRANILQRNATGTNAATFGGGRLVDANVNDVAMTVLPDAPVDPATGLPVPTIAVATAGGVSVIKGDGTVVDSQFNQAATSVAWSSDGRLWLNRSNTQAYYYATNFSTDPFTRSGFDHTTDPAIVPNQSASTVVAEVGDEVAGSAFGFSKLALDQTTPANSMVAYTTSTYNTGWMNGNIKGAFLSDTDDTDLVGSDVVTNGGFATDTDWTKGTGWTIASNVASSDGSQTADSDLEQAVTTVVGKQYILQFTVSNYSAGNVAGVINSTEIVADKAANGSYSGKFTATSTSHTVKIRADLDFVGDIDDVSFSLADADRSVNNNGLIVNGTVTRTAVATGADLVAYSGFSASNYLEQPYNSDLDFGTGDFCVMGWVNGAAFGTTQTIISRYASDSASPDWGVFRQSDGTVSVSIDGSEVVRSASPLAEGLYTFVTVTRSGGSIYLYTNSILQASAANNASLTNASAKLGVGIAPLSAPVLPWLGSLALWRISATAPTVEQIKKIYNDEKVLFQENAQATLYGSSDAVTALAHDSDTGLLHVGTSAGRSVFQGLRRVSNTTTAVGTAISASNGLVVEE